MLEVANDLVADHKTIRIITSIRKAGQLALPIRRHEAERVPPPIHPVMGDAVTLQHNVINTALGEAAAHGQTSLSAADDHHRTLQALEVLSSVALVGTFVIRAMVRPLHGEYSGSRRSTNTHLLHLQYRR